MKYTMICMLFIIAACSNSKNESSLSGTYVGFTENEYGKTDDTLFLTKANSGEGMYQITKHAGLIKIVDGKQLPKELNTETWTLEYNADKQTLFELKEGRTLIWNSGTQSLLLGSTQYKKIASQ